MRKSVLMVGIPVAVVGLGVAAFVGVRAHRPTADAFANDLQAADAAGLQLAAAQTSQKFALSEIAPDSKPEPKTAIHKATSGTRAVRSKAPTVKAAPEQRAADVVEEVPDLSVPQTAAAPTTTQAPVPVAPEPAPNTQPAPSQDQGPILVGGSGRGTGRTTEGGSSGGGWGVILGSILRGGVVDGDNCDPRGGHRAPPPTARMPVYSGNPTGAIGGRSTVGGINPAARGTTMGRPRNR